MSQEVRDFALLAHRDQRYGRGELPFSAHLIDIVEALTYYGNIQSDLINAAWLHDILEDTNITREQIRELAGPIVEALVWAVTDEPGINRKERKHNTYPKIRASRDAITLKLADRIVNVRRSINTVTAKPHFLKEYIEEYPEFRKMLWIDGHQQDMWLHLDVLMARALILTSSV